MAPIIADRQIPLVVERNGNKMFLKEVPCNEQETTLDEQTVCFLNAQKQALEESLTYTIPHYIEFTLKGYRIISSSTSIQLETEEQPAGLLQAEVTVIKIKGSSLVLSFRYRQQYDGRLIATGRQTVSFLDHKSKKTKIPEDVVEVLSKYHESNTASAEGDDRASEKKIDGGRNGTSRRSIPRSQLVRRSDLIPRSKQNNYSDSFIAERRKWVAEKTGADISHIAHYSINPDELKSRIENMVGAAQVPLGIAGPLKVNGEHAQGMFYVPLATNEGTLVETYHRGMFAITMAGGATVRVLNDNLSFSPVFILNSLAEVSPFIEWIASHFEEIKSTAESTTTHGKLLKIVPYAMGRKVILDFRYFTGDAMGLNMVSIATGTACEYIMGHSNAAYYYLASNLSSDKKASFFNFIGGYGKEVAVEATFSREVVLKYLGTVPEALYDFWFNGFMGGVQAGMVGINCHYANALAALYIACGQDVAQIVNASVGTTICELNAGGDLVVSLKLPSIIVATIGGGTTNGTAHDCLELLGCSGPNTSKKFAEIVGATLLAGEVAILAAFTSGNFIKAHVNRRNASSSPMRLPETGGVQIA